MALKTIKDFPGGTGTGYAYLLVQKSDNTHYKHRLDKMIASQVGVYTVAALPALPTSGLFIAFASNGRKAGEGAGAGTGVLVYAHSVDGIWRNFHDKAAVAA